MPTLLEQIQQKEKHQNKLKDITTKLTQRINEPQVKEVLTKGLQYGVDSLIQDRNHIVKLTALKTIDVSNHDYYQFIIEHANQTEANIYIYPPKRSSTDWTIHIEICNWNSLPKKPENYLNAILGINSQSVKKVSE